MLSVKQPVISFMLQIMRKILRVRRYVYRELQILQLGLDLLVLNYSLVLNVIYDQLLIFDELLS
jgi:uncharacterized membrane protein